LQPKRLALQKPVQVAGELSRRAFVVRQNFSNCRRKVIDTRARHDDAVAAAMGFLGDTQESSALVFPELHIEMLALNLQFSRLDNVIHFFLRPPTLLHLIRRMEAKFAGLTQISCSGMAPPADRWGWRVEAFQASAPLVRAGQRIPLYKLTLSSTSLPARAAGDGKPLPLLLRQTRSKTIASLPPARRGDEPEQTIAAKVGHVWSGGEVEVRTRACISVTRSEIEVPEARYYDCRVV
jgi:hypothetical protein